MALTLPWSGLRDRPKGAAINYIYTFQGRNLSMKSKYESGSQRKFGVPHKVECSKKKKSKVRIFPWRVWYSCKILYASATSLHRWLGIDNWNMRWKKKSSGQRACASARWQGLKIYSNIYATRRGLQGRNPEAAIFTRCSICSLQPAPSDPSPHVLASSRCQ